MHSNYFGKKQVLIGIFGEIWRIQTQIYPQTSFEPKYGAFYLKNKVSALELVLLFQLSWRVSPPYVRLLSNDTGTIIHILHELVSCLVCWIFSKLMPGSSPFWSAYWPVPCPVLLVMTYLIPVESWQTVEDVHQGEWSSCRFTLQLLASQ